MAAIGLLLNERVSPRREDPFYNMCAAWQCIGDAEDFHRHNYRVHPEQYEATRSSRFGEKFRFNLLSMVSYVTCMTSRPHGHLRSPNMQGLHPPHARAQFSPKLVPPCTITEVQSRISKLTSPLLARQWLQDSGDGERFHLARRPKQEGATLQS
jgi:hypothetical protein